MITIKQLYELIIIAVCTLCAITFCKNLQSLEFKNNTQTKQSRAHLQNHSTIKATTIKTNTKNQSANKQDQLLGKICKNFNITAQNKGGQGHQEIQKHVKKLNQSRETLIKTTKQASPHLHYIADQLQQRNLPGELALLPMIESNFQPNAISNRGAVGLWQFMPSTGKQFGLKKAGYDGRKDVKASTKAALTYLEYLHKKFNRDWLLALAAYNAGEGAVDRAIKKNQRAGKATNFWSLKLPKQTQAYVPKLLALTQIMQSIKSK